MCATNTSAFARTDATQNTSSTSACAAAVQARSDSSEWQDKWQHAVKELADVKERAWTLLEEKDVQLQALKVTHVAQAYLQHPGCSLVQRLSSCHYMALSWLVLHSCIMHTLSVLLLSSYCCSDRQLCLAGVCHPVPATPSITCSHCSMVKTCL